MKTKISQALFFLTVVLTTVIFAGCNDNYDFGYDVLLISGTESDNLVTLSRDAVEENGYYVTVAATGKTNSPITIQLAIDNSLLDPYNEEYETNFYPYPEADIELLNPEVVIEAGKALSTPATLRINTDNLIDGPTYVVPITITSLSGGDFPVLESSRTVFYRLSKTIEFHSLDMNNSSVYACYIFDDDQMVPLSAFTFEVKVLVESFDIGGTHRLRRIANFSSKNEDVNMIRYGEDRTQYNLLQWVSPGGSIFAKDQSPEGKWHLISLTYDGSTYRMYIDGVLQNQTTGSLGMDFQMIEIGMSWYNTRNEQRVNGRICEMRAWNRALGAREISFGNCAVDPASPGLLAYWRFNEGTGHIFHDETGNGYDMDWSHVWRDSTGNEVIDDTPYDYSRYVVWNGIDQYNTCF